MPAPGFLASRLDDVAILARPDGMVRGLNATLTAGMTCSAATPTHRIPPGTVVVKRTSTGKYLPATDANGDRNAAAVVSSDAAAGGTWASKTITTTVRGKSAAVALGAGDDTTSEVVTALNADAVFKQIAIASGADGAVLVVTSREKGADVSMNVQITTIDTAFGTHDVGKSAVGTDADYLVTAAFADMKDRDSTAQEPSVPTYKSGVFRSASFAVDGSGVSTLTPEAQATLARRGSTFE